MSARLPEYCKKKSVHAIRYDCSEAVRPHCHQLQGIGLCRRSTFVLHVLKMCKTSIQLQIYLTNEMLKKIYSTYEGNHLI